MIYSYYSVTGCRMHTFLYKMDKNKHKEMGDNTKIS